MEQTISVRQFNAMVFLFLTGNFALFEPVAVAEAAQGDALISVAIATLIGLFLTAVWFALVRRFPNINVVQYSHTLLGTRLGQVVGAAYFCVLLLCSGRPMAKLGILGTASFGWGPAIFVLLALFLVVALFLLVQRGLKIIALLCEYAAPLVIILTVVATATTMSKANWANYTFLVAGWGHAWRGATILSTRFCVAFVVLFLTPYTRKLQKTTMLSIMGTVLLVGAIMAICTICIPLYGARTVANSFIPGLQLITDSFRGHYPVLLNVVIALWMFGLWLNSGESYWLLCNTFSETSSIPTRRLLVLVGVATFAFALGIWYDPAQTYTLISHGLRYFLYPTGIGIPLILLLVAWLRERRQTHTPT